jgi:hypothetical protein
MTNCFSTSTKVSVIFTEYNFWKSGITKIIPDVLNAENFPNVSTAALCVGLIIFNPDKNMIIPIMVITIIAIRFVSICIPKYV